MTQTARRRTGLTTVRIRRHTAALILAGSLIALAGCSNTPPKSDASEKDSPVSAAPSDTAATSASPSTDSGAPIEAAYRKYWDEKVKAYGKASVQGTELKKYAVAEAYTQAETEVRALKAKGLVATGKPVLAPTITSVDTQRKTPRGSLTDCTDVSAWKLVKQSNGQEVNLPEGRLTKYVTRVVAEKWYGNWVIVKVTPEDKAC